MSRYARGSKARPRPSARIADPRLAAIGLAQFVAVFSGSIPSAGPGDKSGLRDLTGRRSLPAISCLRSRPRHAVEPETRESTGSRGDKSAHSRRCRCVCGPPSPLKCGGAVVGTLKPSIVPLRSATGRTVALMRRDASWVAILGAVTGLTAFIWNVWRDVRQGARLHLNFYVFAEDTPRRKGAGAAMAVSNSGALPGHITAVELAGHLPGIESGRSSAPCRFGREAGGGSGASSIGRRSACADGLMVGPRSKRTNGSYASSIRPTTGS